MAHEHTARVLKLYRNALQHTRHWTIERAAWRVEALELRQRFKVNKDEKNMFKAKALLERGETEFQINKHPDPYRPCQSLDGTKWERNMHPPAGTCHATAEEQSWLDDKRFWA